MSPNTEREASQGKNQKVQAQSLLEELGLLDTHQKQKPKTISAAQILQQLIETSTLSIKEVRQAHEQLKEAKKEANKEANKEDSNESTKNIHSENNKITPVAANYRQRHVALHVYYDGEKYSGLAENVGCKEDNSVERALFAALQKTNLIPSHVDSETARKSVQYSRCGRTDRGVSATGQVVALKLKSAFSTEASWDENGEELVTDEQLPTNSLQILQVFCPPRAKVNKKKKKSAQSSSKTITDNESKDFASKPQRARRDLSELTYDKILNNVLPPDIRVLGWSPVSSEFSARFSATTRTYRYFFNRENGCLNLDRMQTALALLEGDHDFRNFCKMDVEHVYNFVRRIHYARMYMYNYENEPILYNGNPIPDANGIGYFEIHGQAFLWHQIRCIVSILFLVGRCLEEPSLVSDLMDIKKYPGKPSYPLADERPLVLHHCGYPNLEIGYSVSNLWNLSCHMGQQCEDLLLAAARIRNGISVLKGSSVLVKDVKEFCHYRLLERQKKAAKYGGRGAGMNAAVDPLEAQKEQFNNSTSISWKQALEWMDSLGLQPDPVCTMEVVHVPIAKRSMGSTYEEKVASLQQSSSTKRKNRFEENIIQKRKTREEDQAFYEHMTKQGGSARPKEEAFSPA